MKIKKMQIVIEMSDNAYKAIIGSGYVVSDFNIISAIRNGIVLPEQHGRLIDADKMKTRTNIDMAKKWIDFQETILEGSVKE